MIKSAWFFFEQSLCFSPGFSLTTLKSCSEKRKVSRKKVHLHCSGEICFWAAADPEQLLKMNKVSVTPCNKQGKFKFKQSWEIVLAHFNGYVPKSEIRFWKKYLSFWRQDAGKMKLQRKNENSSGSSSSFKRLGVRVWAQWRFNRNVKYPWSEKRDQSVCLVETLALCGELEAGKGLQVVHEAVLLERLGSGSGGRRN